MLVLDSLQYLNRISMPRTLPAKIVEEEPVINLVQNILPDSKNEYYVALALDKLNIDYIFQYQLGLSGLRGSQVIDFIVYNPHPMAVFVQGEYWHNVRTQTEDQLKFAAAEKMFGRGNVVELMGEETDTPEKALKAVREKL